MANAKDLAAIARTLDGTTEAPHFDRTAFKVKRIYATLAADGQTANLKLAHDEQALKCLTNPQAFAPVPNAWGEKGWTTVTLAAVGLTELRVVLEMAWRHALPTQKDGRGDNRPA